MPTSTATSSAPSAPTTICAANGGAILTKLTAAVNDLQPLGARLPDALPLNPVVAPSLSAQDNMSLNASASFNFTFALPPAQQIAYICGVTAQIVAFQPLPGAIAHVTLPCVDQYYLDPGGWEPSAGPNYPQWIAVGFQLPLAGTYAFSVSFWQTRSGPTITAPDVTATFALGQYLHE